MRASSVLMCVRMASMSTAIRFATLHNSSRLQSSKELAKRDDALSGTHRPCSHGGVHPAASTEEPSVIELPPQNSLFAFPPIGARGANHADTACHKNDLHEIRRAGPAH